MKCHLSIEVSKSADGKPRLTKTGDYRFSVIMRPEGAENTVAVAVHGFRIDKHFTRVTPPMTTYNKGNSIYNIANISHDFEAKAIAAVKSVVQPEVAKPAPEPSQPVTA